VATDKPANEKPRDLTKVIEKPPALLTCGERVATVPYYDGGVDRKVLINDAATGSNRIRQCEGLHRPAHA
jgi:hypothetical protein